MQIGWSQSPPLSDERHEPDLGLQVPAERPTVEEAPVEAAAGTPEGVYQTVQGVRVAPEAGDTPVGVRAVEPSIPHHSYAFEEHPFAADGPSVGKRMLRACSRFAIAALIGVVGTLTLQSHAREAGNLVSAWAPSLGFWPFASRTTPAAEIAGGPEQTGSIPAGPASAQAAELPPPAASPPSTQGAALAPPAPAPEISPPAPAAPSPESAQQLEAIARDLAAVRRSVERLTAEQEQMAKNIVALQTMEQSAKRRAPAPARGAAVAPHRSEPVTAPARRSEPVAALPPPRTAPIQPSTAPVRPSAAPVQSSSIPAPPSSGVASEPPPLRPPMPVR